MRWIVTRCRSATYVVLVCLFAVPAAGFAQLTDEERARPARSARRHMLAQQAERENQRPAVLDTAPITESADEILTFINRVGVDSARRRFMGTAGRGTLCGLAVADRIGTGDSLWLEVAQRIVGWTSICTMYSIRQAVQEALGNAPERVLRLLTRDRRFEFDWTCSSMISYELDNRPRMNALNTAHGATVEAALRRVQAPELRMLVQACAGRLLSDVPCERSEIRQCPAPLPASAPGDSLADAVLRTIATRGVAGAVSRLLNVDELRPSYRARIASGDSIWLAIAAVVAKAVITVPTYKHGRYSDWAFYDFMTAFADALAVAPQTLFSIFVQYPYLQLGWICEGGPVSAADDRERAEVRRIRSGPAVRRITAREFIGLRDMCIARLRG